MVYAPDLCQVLWPGHTGHPRLFRPLALDVLRRDTHWAGTGKTGSVGVFRRSSKFPKRNVLGYVCNPSSSREWDAASQCHTSSVSASVSCIQVVDAGFTACAFYTAGHYVTSPVRSRPFMDRFTFIQSRLRWRHSPSVLRRSILFPKGTGVTYLPKTILPSKTYKQNENNRLCLWSALLRSY